jgi:ketosteroid isomerase-like protein
MAIIIHRQRTFGKGVGPLHRVVKTAAEGSRIVRVSRPRIEQLDHRAPRAEGEIMSGADDRFRTVSEQLVKAMNAHDIEAHVACFAEDYHSEQPAHPARTFIGSDQVRENWSRLFDSIPDFEAELLRVAVVDNTEWGEWIWRGTKEDGNALEERGVTIMGIRDGRIAWGRLYMEDTERDGAGIAETVRRIAGHQNDA